MVIKGSFTTTLNEDWRSDTSCTTFAELFLSHDLGILKRQSSTLLGNIEESGDLLGEQCAVAFRMLDALWTGRFLGRT